MDSSEFDNSYVEMFNKQLASCKKKKDYKKLCKRMINQFSVIEKIDNNQFEIFSSIIGSDNYLKLVALSVKLYLLQEYEANLDSPITEELDDY